MKILEFGEFEKKARRNPLHLADMGHSMLCPYMTLLERN